MVSPLRTLACCVLLSLPVVALSELKNPATEPVDINQATVKQLLQVSGMTAPWATRIVHFRPYRTKLDLLDKGIVPPDVYKRIKDGIVAHRTIPGASAPAKH